LQDFYWWLRGWAFVCWRLGAALPTPIFNKGKIP
jgi:hypothetical protein